MARHALVLSGGGARGSYEAGAVAALMEWFEHTPHPITILSGTSVGALNAAAVLHGGPRYPMRIWWTISNDKVYRRPSLSLVGLLLSARRRSALYDTTPLRNLIWASLDPVQVAESDLELYVHATDLGSKQKVVFTGEDPDLREGVLASASVPGAFPPVAWRGTWLVDGGTVDNSPLSSAIRAGAEKITVVYLDDDMPPEPAQAEGFAPIEPARPLPSIEEVLGSTIEAMTDAHFHRDLRNVRLINRLVEAGDTEYRRIDLRVFSPARPLVDTLDFDNLSARRQLNHGFHDANDWLRGG